MLVIISGSGFTNIGEDSLFVPVEIFNEDCEPDLKVIGENAGTLAFNINGGGVVAEVELLPCGIGATKLPVPSEDGEI